MLVPIPSDDVLLCFAVKEEAAFCGRLAPRILITGMGTDNARRSVAAELGRGLPSVVLSCGFAGGLLPELKAGDVIFHVHDFSDLANALEQAGARPSNFHATSRIATTAAEKRALREQTGADAVEMESQAIRAVCLNHRVPCATVRVISDAADEDLPFDFNRFLNARNHLRLEKLLASLAVSPGKIPALLRLRRNTRHAAQRLAEVLSRVIRS